MDEHDRAAAFAAFDTALVVSPSTALTYILGRSSLSGNIVVAYPQLRLRTKIDPLNGKCR